MIRLASLGVLLAAGVLAYLGFALMRGSGGDPSETPADVAEATAPPAPQAQSASQAARLYFLQDQDLTTGELALILHGAGPQGEDLIVTDTAALQAAQADASVTSESTTGQVFGAIVLAVMGVPPEQMIASLYRNDSLVLHVTCASTTCGDFAEDGHVDLAGLDAVADPLIRIDDSYDDYTSYLDALTAIAADPDFALLGLRPNRDETHPVAQSTPKASMALPTIVRPADQPLDVNTHTALLSALLQDTLPEGISVDAVTIRDLGPPVVVDADNGRPATAGGQPILFPAVRFYTPYVAISGASDLPDQTLEALTEQTLLRVDYASDAKAFIASLGVPCPDCFDIEARGDTYAAATVIHRQPETYPLSYYDLREAP
ncbi:hypothetical protein [Pseudooctadecabacter sp.]|uniref:hypothetical protein n=1 Tax=Pseudooctadecabacter sp. TaxID=1966338 RepID=UPI0035C83D64